MTEEILSSKREREKVLSICYLYHSSNCFERIKLQNNGYEFHIRCERSTHVADQNSVKRDDHDQQ